MRIAAFLAGLLLVANALAAEPPKPGAKNAKAQAEDTSDRVDLATFFGAYTKYQDMPVVLRGDIAVSGSYISLVNPDNAKDKRYARLELDRQQTDWVRKNCMNGCIVEITGRSVRAAPWGLIEVKSIKKTD